LITIARPLQAPRINTGEKGNLIEKQSKSGLEYPAKVEAYP
jgi:hypothetical protein